MRILILPILPLALSACVVATVAETAVYVVALPVKAVSKGVDMATTSQSEADEKRGRALRREEEKAGKAAREAEEKRAADCKAATARGEPCAPAPEPQQGR